MAAGDQEVALCRLLPLLGPVQKSLYHLLWGLGGGSQVTALETGQASSHSPQAR